MILSRFWNDLRGISSCNHEHINRKEVQKVPHQSFWSGHGRGHGSPYRSASQLAATRDAKQARIAD